MGLIMKKILSVLALVLFLTSCASNGKSDKNIEGKESTNTEIEEVSKANEDSNNSKQEDEKEDESKKEANVGNQELLIDKDVKIDKDNIFYIPNVYLVQFDRNDKLVDLDGNTKFENGSMFFEKVPDAITLFVGRSTDNNEYGIYDLVGRNLNLLFRFAQNDEFHPIGMIGNKVYGYHYLTVVDEDDNIVDSKNTLGYFDIENKDLKDYTGQFSTNVTSIANTRDKVYFINNESDKNNLYAFSPESDLSAEPELVEKDYDSYDIYATSYKDGPETVNEYFKADAEGIHIGDQVWEIPAKADGLVDIKGKYILYYTKSTGENPSDYEQNLKIYHAYDGDMVFDENIRGQKYLQKTLYYIDEDNNIGEFEIDFQ